MSKRLTGLLLIVAIAAVLIPFSVSASALIPAYTGFATTETSIKAGESVTFTISTLAAVNHVFTEVDGVRVNAVQQTRPVPPEGTKNWTLTFIPAETQVVTVHANITNVIRDAAVISIPVTVTGTLPGVVAISSVRRNATEYFAGDAVIFTIVTSEAAEHVFTQVDGAWIRAVLNQTNEETGDKTWQLTARPQVTQTLRIYANTEYVRGRVFSLQAVEIKQIPLLTDVLQPFEKESYFSYVNSVVMSGRTYGNAIRLARSNLIYLSGADAGARAWGVYNLGGQYHTISGIVGRVDGSHPQDATINFIGDGRIIASFNIRHNEMPREISVNVRGVTQLRIEMSSNHPTGSSRLEVVYAIAETTIR
jgi:hypothetical protein